MPPGATANGAASTLKQQPGVRVITRETAGQQGELFELPPSITARVNLAERWRRTGSRFGDLSASQLTSIRNKLFKGDPWDWVDLCEFWLNSDPDLASLCGTRLDRLMDREWEVVPNEFGDQRLAQDAANLVHELLAKIENWDHAIRMLGGAVSSGFAASECQWEYDRGQKVFYAKRIHDRHAHRFRWGPHWDLRFYDKGQRPGADGYGETLDPKLWIVHVHQEQPGYPCNAGLQLPCSYHNAFSRWVEKMRIGAVEKWGQPIPVLTVTGDTPEASRQQQLEDLQQMSSDGAFVTEAPNVLAVLEGTSGGSGSMHKETLDDYYKQRARLWLGTSDMADPGKFGTQGAVGERVDATSDPKTVADAKRLAQSLHLSLLRNFVLFNAKKLGGNPADIPVPKLKAWKDESDMQSQPGPMMGGEQRQPGIMPNGQPAPRITEIQLARDHDPKAAASGEPRRVRRVVGRAATHTPTPSTSLETKLAAAVQRALATPASS
jgi:phage gp29-like protein